MALDGWDAQNCFKLTIDGSKVNGSLTNFPVLISLTSGTGQTSYDVTAVFDELSPTVISGVSVSGTHDDYTKLVLHMDGANESTVFIDDTEKHVVTAYDNAKISTSQFKFNGTSGYFDGTGDYLTVPDSSDWDLGTGDFTLDCWIYPTSIPSVGRMISRGDVEADTGCWTWGFGTTWGGGTKFNFADIDGGITDHLSDAVTININTWYHVSVVRYSGNIIFYLNGINVGTSACAHTLNSDKILYIGCRATGPKEYFPGYIDEMRISKGISRWISNFVSPTGPYGSSWDNRKKISVSTDVEYPGFYDYATKLMLHMDGDKSSSQHTVTVHGDPDIYVSGAKFDGSVYFDGSGDYLSLATSDDWDFGTDDFTIDWWFNADTVAGDDGMFSLRQSTSTLLNVRTGGGYDLTIRVNGGTYHTSIEAGIWYHLAIVRCDNNIKLYLNGTLFDTVDVTSVSFDDSDGGVWIGQYYSTSYPFQGYMDEFRVSKGIARWTSNFTPSTEPYTTDSGTVLLLHFDGDRSNSDHTITFYGDPQIYGSEGMFCGSYKFDGTGDYLSIDDNQLDFSFVNYNFTVDFWVYLLATGSIYCMFSKGGGVADWNTTNGFEYHFSYWSDNKLNLQYNTNGSYADFWSTDAVTLLNDWHHVALVGDQYYLKMYVDGSEVGSMVRPTLYSVSSSTTYIGQISNNSYRFNGYIDEFRVSKGVTRWTSNFTLPTEAYPSIGELELPVEIEYWDSINEKACLWTKVPTLSSGTNKNLYFYYDINHSNNVIYIGDTGELPAQQIWDDNFVGVWHMAQDPVGGVGSILDSTILSNNLSPGGTMISNDLVNGRLSKALDFDGTDDYLQNTDPNSLDLTSLTIESVAYRRDTGWNAIVDHAQEGTTIENYGLFFSDGTLYFQYYNGGWQSLTQSAYVGTDTWFDVSVTYSGGSIVLYKDGGEVTSSSGEAALITNASNVFKAARYQVDSQGYANMIIDELRISNIDRDPSWVETTYYSNWNDLITFSEIEFISFSFSNPVPTPLSTAYGTTQTLRLTVTVSGEGDSYKYNASFYDASTDIQIGSTVSGVDSSQTASTLMTTVSAMSYSWYLSAVASGESDTSPTYSFDNKFLCAGTTEVNGTLTSGIPVRLYLRSDGSYIGGTISAGVSGTFEIETDYNDYHYAVAIIYPDDDATNAEIYDWLQP